MNMKTIGQHVAALRDASGARQSTCNFRTSRDHRKRREPSVHPARVIEIIWQIALRVTRIVGRSTAANSGTILRSDLHSLVKKCIERRENGIVAVTIFGLQQSHANKRKYFCFSKFDEEATQAIPATLTVTPHAFSYRGANRGFGWWRSRQRHS
jgi:hypothetical protein